MEKEKATLAKYLKKAGQRQTSQRLAILEIFLRTERHLTAEELYRLVRARHPNIGFSTVYRTMSLFARAGISGSVDAGDGKTRFEHRLGHEHHDHLICTKCSKFIEVRDDEIERLQERLARSHGFRPESHRMEIFGVCRSCGASRKRR